MTGKREWNAAEMDYREENLVRQFGKQFTGSITTGITGYT
jgi:hypothetical protein